MKLLVIDGNSIINRGFYGIRLLSTKEGMYTNALVGFLNILFHHMETEHPDGVVVAFDLKDPTFRHKMYDAYKAQRKGMPPELAMQMPVMKKILEGMNIPYLELSGYEADDIIGTISRVCDEAGVECLIATGDKDDLQLASKNTRILLTTTRMGKSETVSYDADGVKEKYGVTPHEFIDVKALMGDPSDNIPGVSGVGEKTAFSLIGNYGSIEYIYEHLDEIELKNSVREKLVADKDMAFLSKKLATIDRFVPMEITPEAYRNQRYNAEMLLPLFQKLEFHNYIKKLDLATEEAVSVTRMSTTLLEGFDSIDQAKHRITSAGKLCLKIFTEGDRLSAMFLSDGEIGWVMVPDAFHPVSDWKDVLEDESIAKFVTDSKEAINALEREGVSLCGVRFDFVLAGYLLNPAAGTYEMSSLGNDWGVTIRSEEAVFGKGKARIPADELGTEELLSYAAELLPVMVELYPKMENRLTELGQTDLYTQIELPLAEVLADMERQGFYVNRKSLEVFSETLRAAIEDLEQKIYDLAGEEFNIQSPKQLGVVLFEKMGLPPVKKTKTGYSTNAEVLEKLKWQSPIVEYILEYRQLTKLKSTYADGLLAAISPDGKIHSVFNQTVTTTGRISSTEPNLQNIPVRLELGREVRKMFSAKAEDGILVGADYSQIELRVLAHMADDPAMIEAFRGEEDFHRATAAQVFGVPIEEVTGQMRSAAKAVNFGIVYGIGAFSLAQDLHISVKEAKAYMESYLARYTKVQEYMTNVVEAAKENGYVTTLYGRRRYIPELASNNHMLRAFGERVALNAPIQGTAADIIKIAMVRVYKALQEKTEESHLILQVHDELIVETTPKEQPIVEEILKQEMEHAANLSVPLTVNVSAGKTWYDTK